MPIRLTKNQLLNILITNHSISHYFKTLIFKDIIAPQTLSHQFKNGIQNLVGVIGQLEINQTISLVINHNVAQLNQKLNQYLNNWSHVLFNQPWANYDFTDSLTMVLDYLFHNPSPHAFQTYQSYQPRHLTNELQQYLTLGDTIESQFIQKGGGLNAH